MVARRARGATSIATADLRDEAGATTPEVGERAHLEEALARARGNVAEAADALGVSRSKLYDTMRRLGLSPEAFRR